MSDDMNTLTYISDVTLCKYGSCAIVNKSSVNLTKPRSRIDV